jgi:hypothetical protein
MNLKKRQKRESYLPYILFIITFMTTMGAVLSQQMTDTPINALLGLIGHIIFLCGGIYLYIYTQKREVVQTKNTLLLLFFIYHVILIALMVMLNITDLSYYLLPIPIAGMLIALLLDTHLALVINGFLTILASFISPFTYEILIFYLISGAIASLLIIQTKQRHNFVWVAATIMSVNALLTMFINLSTFQSVRLMDFIYGALNGGFAVILAVGSLPLWESVFDVATPLKLLELTNSDQKLIQRLLLEAPGTFHHVQLVANLSETAAKDIGSDYLLARAGALYHDIGKLKNPELFKENQTGENPHDDLDPQQSAKIILDHVTYGVQLANEYKLPNNVKAIIQQHQGTTLVKFFYHKAKDIEPDVDEVDYRYIGPKPQSNEAALVMLADSVEAAVRCIPQEDKTLEKIHDVIKKIIKMKLDEGQLEESDIKIKELDLIGAAFLKVYKGMYHKRIDYPKE